MKGARNLTALFLTGAVLIGCSGAPASYTEGRVEVSGDTVTLDKRPLPASLPDSALQGLRRLDGLDVGVTFRGGDAEIVSPVNDKWRAFAAMVDVPDDVDPRERATWPDGPEPRHTFPDQQRLDAVVNAYRALDAGVGAFTKAAPPPREAWFDMANRYGRLETAAYEGAAVAKDEATRRILLDMGLESGQKMVVVMSYPTSDRFPPDWPDRVAANRNGAIAITKDGALAGTGFFVSANWLVTNRHVANAISDRSRAKVRFAGDQPRDPCAVTNIISADKSSPLDIAAIRFQCPAAIPANWILQLANRYTAHNELLYIHGFFQDANNKKFFLPAWVRYPHQVSTDLREGLRRKISNPAEAELFDRFYRQCQPAAPLWCYLSSNDRWGPQGSGATPEIPTMGFDSNTGKGNSGSPVFSAHDHLVVGVFFAGAEDYQAQGNFTFDRHEAAIPSPLVLEWLKSVNVLP